RCMSVDPAFVNPANGDFHLAAGSPCIDAVVNADATGVDLDGAVRNQDGDGYWGAQPDLGCYEAAGVPQIATQSCTPGGTVVPLLNLPQAQLTLAAACTPYIVYGLAVDLLTVEPGTEIITQPGAMVSCHSITAVGT